MSFPAEPGRLAGHLPLQYLTGAGPHASPVTSLTWFLLGISVVVILIFTVAVIWGTIARRQRTTDDALSVDDVGRSHSGLAWVYIGMPLTLVVLVVALFWTMIVMARIDQPATPTTLTIEVTGRQWWWQVRYPAQGGGRAFETANEIHIPAGQPVLVKLRGGDVIHSFWVPALAGKTDTIPGRDNVTWLQADKPGIYRGQCTEYCGTQHAHMAFFVIAEPAKAFTAWRRNQERPATPVPVAPAVAPRLTPVAYQAPRAPMLAGAGESLFVQHCGMCHAMRGTAAHGNRGPDLTHLMTRRTLAAGTLSNTVNNLSGWISDPAAQKPGVHMPITDLSGPQLQAVVAYLKAQR